MVTFREMTGSAAVSVMVPRTLKSTVAGFPGGRAFERLSAARSEPVPELPKVVTVIDPGEAAARAAGEDPGETEPAAVTADRPDAARAAAGAESVTVMSASIV